MEEERETAKEEEIWGCVGTTSLYLDCGGGYTAFVCLTKLYSKKGEFTGCKFYTQ